MTPLEFWKSLKQVERGRIRSDMTNGFIGHYETLRTDLVVSSAVLEEHLPFYKLFERGQQTVARAAVSSDFLQRTAWVADGDNVVEHLWRYFDFFHEMKRGGMEIWSPRLFLEQDFCRRFDGKHRTCLLRYFEVELVECIVANIRDIKEWRAKGRNLDKFWTERESSTRPKREPEARQHYRCAQVRERHARHRTSKKRQRRKRQRGLID